MSPTDSTTTDAERVWQATWRCCWRGLLMLGAVGLASGAVHSLIGVHAQDQALSQNILAAQSQIQNEQDRQADLAGEIEFTRSIRGTITKGRTQGLGRADEHRAILVPDDQRPSPPGAQ